MSDDNNVSEFPGRKPTEFNSETNIHHFNQQVAHLINSNTDKVAMITVIGSLEIMKADILGNTQRVPAEQGSTH